MVKCSASIIFPDLTAASVSAESASVQSDKPTSVWFVEDGRVGFPNDEPIFFGAVGRSEDIPRGQQWRAAVFMPSVFASVGGNCGFAQIVTGQYCEFYTTTVGIGHHKRWSVAVPALDGSFPYDTFALGDYSNTGDTPGYPLDDSITDLTIGNDFLTWLMFCPANGTWVPLRLYTWSWGGSLRHNNGVWEPYGCLLWHSSPSNINDHPTWDKVASSGLAVSVP